MHISNPDVRTVVSVTANSLRSQRIAGVNSIKKIIRVNWNIPKKTVLVSLHHVYVQKIGTKKKEITLVANSETLTNV